MTVHLHEEDIPADLFAPGAAIAVDTETMGLITPRDRLCLVQLSDGGPDEHLVRFSPGSDYAAPNLKALLAARSRVQLYHFARFDLAAIEHYLGVEAGPVYSTMIASRLVRKKNKQQKNKKQNHKQNNQKNTKTQQSSDWGGPVLSDAQK